MHEFRAGVEGFRRRVDLADPPVAGTITAQLVASCTDVLLALTAMRSAAPSALTSAANVVLVLVKATADHVTGDAKPLLCASWTVAPLPLMAMRSAAPSPLTSSVR